jgi:hypothetical protein
MPQWPSRYAISKYIDYVGPAFSAELSTAFYKGQEEGFDLLREIRRPETTTHDLSVKLAERVATEVPGRSE